MKKVVRYQANDGKEFATVEECRAHDKATKQRPKLFVVVLTVISLNGDVVNDYVKAVCLTEECANRTKEEELVHTQRAYVGAAVEVSVKVEPVPFIKDKK